jgi:4-hydroxy-4-methyl-2-oxoglutarate aldolase
LAAAARVRQGSDALFDGGSRMSISPAQVERARCFASATLHEASGRKGALPSSLRPLTAATELCGPAFTLSCPPGDNLCLHVAIEQAPEGSVLVAQTGDLEYGYWGEVMTVAAQARGFAGLVIAGGVRDTRRIVELGFPLFSATVCIRGTVKDPDAGGRLRDALAFGDTIVSTGDLIRGDADGLCSIAAHSLEAALAAAEARELEEAAIIDALQRGASTMQLYRLAGSEACADGFAQAFGTLQAAGALTPGRTPSP